MADLIRLAIPHQLHFPLIIKQQETIRIRQRPVRLQVGNNVPLFVVREFHYVQ